MKKTNRTPAANTSVNQLPGIYLSESNMSSFAFGCMTVVLMLSVYVGCLGQRNITAETGQNVTLTCRAPNSSEILVIEWTRPGLKGQYVFLYRDGRSDPENQHPSFKERVELKDSQMKDGDVSVTLKNVTFTDTGTYECRVVQSQTKRRKRGALKTEPISIVHLRVSAGHREDGGDQDGGDQDGGDQDGGDQGGGDKDGGGNHGDVGLAVGLTVVGVLLLVAAVVGFMFYRKRCRCSEKTIKFNTLLFYETKVNIVANKINKNLNNE